MVVSAELATVDQVLIKAAERTLLAHWRPDWNQVAAAVMTREEKIYSAFNLDTYVGAVGICAEPIAIGQALLATDGDSACEIVAIVALRGSGTGKRPDKITLVSPCGKCRELIADYAPGAAVIVPGKQGPHRRSIAELLPNKYHRGD